MTGSGPLAGRQLELSGLRADGSDFPLELTVARIGSDNRAVLTGFVRDITERRALEEQLRQSQKLEAIGRLAGGVAHDFNNILMSIMGAADLLLMQLAPDDAARDEATEIKQSVDRGAGLTRQLLAFSRRQVLAPRVRTLTCAGTRAAELALRMKYAGVPVERLRVVPELSGAFDRAIADNSSGRLFVLPTYTALLELREELAARGLLTRFWEARR